MTSSSPSSRPRPAPVLTEVPLDLWADSVATARRHRGMSQHALARASGVTQQTISKIELGEICPHDKLKLRLARALGVPPGVLFPWPTPGP